MFIAAAVSSPGSFGLLGRIRRVLYLVLSPVTILRAASVVSLLVRGPFIAHLPLLLTPITMLA